MNVLVILGHPRKESFCGALTRAYIEGASAAGVTVQELTLCELDFDPDVHHSSPRDQAHETDILRAQEAIAWADHLVFIFPTWWGTMPALLKGFLDRVLTPGFAFHERESGGYEPLLTGKSAHLITTMDTPPWVYRLIYHAPGLNALGGATLGFCGVTPIRTHVFGPIKHSSAETRRNWRECAFREGERLRLGVLTPAERLRKRANSWLSALRLQFYPMAGIAYTVGALAAAPDGLFTRASYWLGYLCLFFIEAATVLTNEYFDYETDRQNRNYGPFNGGARMLVTGRLTFPAVRRGIAIALLLATLSAISLCIHLPVPNVAGCLLTTGLLLGIGYTLPPIRLSYRGWGEVTVGVTHGLLTVLCGFVFQGGDWNHPLPWMLGAILGLSLLPSIILAGLPDAEADGAVGKRTLVVRLGEKRAVLLAMLLTVLSAGIISRSDSDIWRGASFFILPHALLLLTMLSRHQKIAGFSGRIDGLMIAALTYHAWFGLIPLINQLSH